MTDTPEGTQRSHNSPRLGPIELLHKAIARYRGRSGPDDDQLLEDISDETLDDAAFEMRQRASYVGWMDEKREEEYLAIADHLNDQRQSGDHDE